MKEKKYYYHIHSETMEPCNLTKELYAIADETWLCTGCNYPKRECKVLDITIQGKMINGSTLNFVFGAGIPVVKREFLYLFGQEIVEKDLYVGEIYAEDGTLLEDWVTFRGKRKIIIRGTEHAGYRRCDLCGCNCYFAMDRQYLYPKPPIDALLFESGYCSLVFSEEFYDKINLNCWEDLIIEKLPVLDYPKDGFVELTSFYDENFNPEMRNFILYSDIDKYQYVLFVDSKVRDHLEDTIRNFIYIGKNWKPIEVAYDRKDEYLANRLKGDFPTCASPVLIFTKNAIDKLYDLLEPNGEILPLLCNEDELYAYNVTKVVDALDYEKSRIVRFCDGEIKYIQHVAFKKEMETMVQNIPIFKLPETLLKKPFVNEVFRRRVETEKLLGFKFQSPLGY